MEELARVFDGCVVFYFLPVVNAIERRPSYIKPCGILAQYKQADKFIEKTKSLFYGKSTWLLERERENKENKEASKWHAGITELPFFDRTVWVGPRPVAGMFVWKL